MLGIEKINKIPISFDNFIEEESIVVVLLGFWAFNIRKRFVIFKILFFGKNMKKRFITCFFNVGS